MWSFLMQSPNHNRCCPVLYEQPRICRYSIVENSRIYQIYDSNWILPELSDGHRGALGRNFFPERVASTIGKAVLTCFPDMCTSLAIISSSCSSVLKLKLVSRLSYFLW